MRTIHRQANYIKANARRSRTDIKIYTSDHGRMAGFRGPGRVIDPGTEYFRVTKGARRWVSGMMRVEAVGARRSIEWRVYIEEGYAGYGGRFGADREYILYGIWLIDLRMEWEEWAERESGG